MTGKWSNIEVIDLTAPMTEDMWRYSDIFPAFSARSLTDYQADGYVITEVTIGTHLGTHTDAGTHFSRGAWSIGDINVARYVGGARVVRLPDRDPLEPIDASAVAAAGAALDEGDGALLATGWDARYGSSEYATHHPFLTEGAAEWLIDRGVTFIGADLPGLMDPRLDLAPPQDAGATTDGKLLAARIPYVVGLVNVSRLRADECLFVGAPLRFDGLDGAPVRAIAIVG